MCTVKSSIATVVVAVWTPNTNSLLQRQREDSKKCNLTDSEHFRKAYVKYFPDSTCNYLQELNIKLCYVSK